MLDIVIRDYCKKERRHLKKPTWPRREQLELSCCLRDEKGSSNQEQIAKKGHSECTVRDTRWERPGMLRVKDLPEQLVFRVRGVARKSFGLLLQ